MTQTVQTALIAGTTALREAGVTGASRDAQVLMAAALGVPIDRLILAMQDPIEDDQSEAYAAKLAQRIAGAPVSHIIGGRLFYDRWFRVTPDVLDPRPETEVLVAEALSAPFQQVLDLGTGSGAIVVSLLAARPDAQGVGTDISAAALAVAGQNAESLGVADRLRLLHSDWCAAVTGQFDLIVSNPPYIALAEMADLQPEVRAFEPEIALTDHGDGLSAYRIICAQAPDRLVPGGRLLVEIGPTQAADVRGFMAAEGFAQIKVVCDFDGRDRVVCAQKPAV